MFAPFSGPISYRYSASPELLYIYSVLTYKSDGLKGAVQPVLYRVGAASLRPRCSVLSLYFELLYFLKLIRTELQFYLLHGTIHDCWTMLVLHGVLTATRD